MLKTNLLHLLYFSMNSILVALLFIIKSHNSAIISIIFLLVSVFIFGYFKRKMTINKDLSLLILCCFILLQGLMIASILATKQITSVIFLLAGINLMYFLINYLSLNSYLYQKRIDAIQEEIKHFNQSVQHLRIQRHDFLKHVNALDYMFGSKEYDQAHQYMKSLVQDYQTVNGTIQGESSHMTAVLLKAVARSRYDKIKLHLHSNQPISHIPLPPVDQVNLISNLLMQLQLVRKKRLFAQQENKKGSLFSKSRIQRQNCQTKLPIIYFNDSIKRPKLGIMRDWGHSLFLTLLSVIMEILVIPIMAMKWLLKLSFQLLRNICMSYKKLKSSTYFQIEVEDFIFC